MPRNTLRTGQARTKSMPWEPISLSGDGVIESISALTGNVDLDGEMFGDVAFNKTVGDRAGNFGSIPMGVDHDTGFGVTTHMEVVPRSALSQKALREAPDATGGLYTIGQVVMMDPHVTTFEEIKARTKAGRPPGTSITFYSNPKEERVETIRGRSVTVIGEAAVTEWGPALRKKARNPGATVTRAKAGETDPREKSAAYLPNSYEERKSVITGLIQESGMFGTEEVYVEGSFQDYVVVCVYPQMEYHIVYYAIVNDKIVLGESSPADVSLTLTMKASAEQVVDEAAASFKAGRVIRKNLLTRLDAALAELAAIRAAATSADEDDDPESTSTDAAPEPASKATEPAPATDPEPEPYEDPADMLAWEIDMLQLRSRALAAGG